MTYVQAPEMNSANERVFIDEVADILEADPEKLTLASDFREAADFWSSLVGFALLCYLEERHSAVLSVEAFIECRTIGDLYVAITRQ